MKKEFCLVELSISAFGESTIGTVISLHTTEKAAEAAKKKNGLNGYQGKGERKILRADVIYNDNNYKVNDCIEY